MYIFNFEYVSEVSISSVLGVNYLATYIFGLESWMSTLPAFILAIFFLYYLNLSD